MYYLTQVAHAAATNFPGCGFKNPQQRTVFLQGGRTDKRSQSFWDGLSKSIQSIRSRGTRQPNGLGTRKNENFQGRKTPHGVVGGFLRLNMMCTEYVYMYMWERWRNHGQVFKKGTWKKYWNKYHFYMPQSELEQNPQCYSISKVTITKIMLAIAIACVVFVKLLQKLRGYFLKLVRLVS